MITTRAQKAGSAFVTTHWTRVLEARGDSADAKAALSELCEAYYAPVFAFIRRNTPNEETARDLTQEFFRRQLERNGIHDANPAGGKFRSYLLGAVIHFLADAREHAKRQKRGGGKPHESLDATGNTDTESSAQTRPRLDLSDPRAPNPEREFDRKWAMTVLSRALDALAEEHRNTGTFKQFEALKVWLMGDTEGISQAETARALGMNEGAVKVAIHRLRKEFRQQIKNEIARTVKRPSQVAEEMKSLLAALA